MIISTEIQGKIFRFDLDRGIDISIPLRPDIHAASAWYVPPITIEPVRSEFFVGDVNEGGSVNFNNITFNPHGNGTHTEGVGHISKNRDSVNKGLKKYFFPARLITIFPEVSGEDHIITLKQVKEILKEPCEAVIIRTIPNGAEKLTRQYSNTNPPYIHSDVIPYLLSLGIDHILIDLPSVDRESDAGALASHHVFWNYPRNPQYHRTITEFIYVPQEVSDGFYLLNLQAAPFENDATPSRPVLYKALD